jgi:hypothetical protein
MTQAEWEEYLRKYFAKKARERGVKEKKKQIPLPISGGPRGY